MQPIRPEPHRMVMWPNDTQLNHFGNGCSQKKRINYGRIVCVARAQWMIWIIAGKWMSIARMHHQFSPIFLVARTKSPHRIALIEPSSLTLTLADAMLLLCSPHNADTIEHGKNHRKNSHQCTIHISIRIAERNWCIRCEVCHLISLSPSHAWMAIVPPRHVDKFVNVCVMLREKKNTHARIAFEWPFEHVVPAPGSTNHDIKAMCHRQANAFWMAVCVWYH